MRNILLTIEYDGTAFSGWQRQLSVRTVQGELEETLSLLCRQSVKLSGTSRTDAGVHAFGQRANFFLETPIPTDKIKTAANNLLPGEVRIREVCEVSADFHARFAAKGKKYIYRIENNAEKDVFTHNYCYNIQKHLDLAAMRKAAENFVGTHDFRSFMAAGGQERESTVRTIYGMRLTEYEEQAAKAGRAELPGHAGQNAGTLLLEVTGNGFLYNMVRIITGTLVDVGIGKIKPDQIPDIIKAKERQRAGHTAPPQGLYLAEVYFRDCAEI